MKKHKFKIIISSVLILLPTVLGLIFYDRLPEQIITHFGIDGTPDRISSPFVAVIVFPLVLLAVNFLCLFATAKDPKNDDQNQKALGIIFWIIPAISWFACATMFFASQGAVWNAAVVLPLVFGTLFIVIGNYMPKIKQNSTLGIKMKSTLESKSNWNATHRFAGKIWFVGGILILLSTLVPNLTAMLIIVFFLLFFNIISVFVFSVNYRRKQLKSENNDIIPRAKTKIEKIAILFLIPILALVAIVMFTGNVEVALDEESISVDSCFWSESRIKFDQIESAELEKDFDFGLKTSGFNSAKLLLGFFRNDELGDYTVYSYKKSDSVVLLKIGKRHLAIGLETEEETTALYEKIKEKLK